MHFNTSKECYERKKARKLAERMAEAETMAAQGPSPLIGKISPSANALKLIRLSARTPLRRSTAIHQRTNPQVRPSSESTCAENSPKSRKKLLSLTRLLAYSGSATAYGRSWPTQPHQYRNK